jgi:starch phosphorylase
MPDTFFPLQVFPRIPAALGRLPELAENFWFSWYPATGQFFRKLDAALWRKVDGNPKLFLKCVAQGILERAAEDRDLLAEYTKLLFDFDRYLAARGTPHPDLDEGDLIAYFCAEYGLHESFPIYSGGLGVLAGDHCKTASDLCLPFVAVGLLYRQGYFNQRIDRHGNQVPEYPPIEARHTPLSVALDDAGRELHVTCPFADRVVLVRLWRAAVGRVTLVLLDTDIEENSPEDRRVTHKLYGGDRELRMQQEAVLGVAGVRALRALGLHPTVWHINEGHAAFSVLERVREYTAAGLPFAAALEATAASTVFTTHTPVSAGHDVFAPERVADQFKTYPEALGIDEQEMLALGRTAEQHDGFNMTRLAISGAAAVNGVSKIHGGVSSRLCQSNWQDVPPEENPVGYVTNGVHVATFMRQPWVRLLDEFLGTDWQGRLMDRPLLKRIREIPDERFWGTNQKVKSQMLRVVRERLDAQHTRNGLSEAHSHRLLKLVNPENPNVLTVGFARRFATYKRATLLLSDLGWLEQLVNDEDRPVLFIFAGKAHPADEPAQHMMREIQRISAQPPFVGKLLMLEGYDMGVARLLTAGVDVWLNTPVHPLEASGTSGMKAAINGTLNLSVLDGWWAEAYDGKNGWGIPPALDIQGPHDRDRQDAVTLYEILQDEVIPLYYEQDDSGYSPGWVQRCKRSMSTILPRFNSERVLRDYLQQFYVPAANQGRTLAADDFRVARELAEWKRRVRAAWNGVALKMTHTAMPEVRFDDAVTLGAEVQLNGLSPEDVRVECVIRRVLGSELAMPLQGYAENRRPTNGVSYVNGEPAMIAAFTPDAPTGENGYRYKLELKPPWAGQLVYEIRAVPQHRNLSHPYELGLMRKL